MKAVILAGGLATRLRPLTEDLPKALVPIGNKPILEHQIEFLKQNNITEIYLLVGHLKEKVKRYFGSGEKWGVTLHYQEESTPLGTAGALKPLETKIKEDFIVFFCDIFLDLNLKEIIEYHNSLSDKIATIVLQPKDYPQQCDHVELSKDNKILNIITRPFTSGNKIRNLATASIHLCTPRIFTYIREGKEQGFEKDLIKELLNKNEPLYGFITPGYCKDMGTHSRLKEVENDYKTGETRKLIADVTVERFFIAD